MTKIVSNGFERIFKSSLQELQIKKDFCDVTLACEEYKIETHKIIISTNSPVLGSILKLNHNPHPFIYLRSVKYKDLQNLLNFMYQGEVNIANDDLYSFLELAKDLKVKGLLEEKIEDLDLKEDFPQPKNQNAAPHLKRKRKNMDHEKGNENMSLSDNSKSNESSTSYSHRLSRKAQKKLLKQVKKKPKFKITTRKNINKYLDFSKSVNDSEYENFLKVDEDLKNKEVSEGYKYDLSSKRELINVFDNVDEYLEMHDSTTDDDNDKLSPQFLDNLQNREVKEEKDDKNITVKCVCVKCNRTFAMGSSLSRHIQSVHDGAQFPCSQCDYRATQKSNLKKHVASLHEGVGFSCNLCDYKGTQKSNLKGHMLSKHSCRKCDYQVASKHDLKIHVESVHNEALDNFVNETHFDGTGIQF